MVAMAWDVRSGRRRRLTLFGIEGLLADVLTRTSARLHLDVVGRRPTADVFLSSKFCYLPTMEAPGTLMLYDIILRRPLSGSG